MIGRDTLILLSDGSTKPIQDLREGDVLKCGYKVRLLIEHTHGPFDVAILNSGTCVSMWHPILLENFWAFPIHSANRYKIDSTEPMYDLILDSGHSVETSGGEAFLTLGHGRTDLVASHDYFGTQKVTDDFSMFRGHVSVNVTPLRNSSGLVYKWIIETTS